MLWFFEKDGERLQCEIRPSAHAAGFELEIVAADGNKTIERSDNPDELALRWMEVEQRLKREGWILQS